MQDLLTSLFTDASALRRVGTMSSSMYCLADMAATSAAVWTDGVEAVGAAGADTRGFLTAGGSAVSETRGIVDVCTCFNCSSSTQGFSSYVLTFLLSGHRVVGHDFDILVLVEVRSPEVRGFDDRSEK